MKEEYDGAEPSNNSVSALNLLRYLSPHRFKLMQNRLAMITGNETWRECAEKTFSAFYQILNQSPIVMPYMCVAVDFYLSTPKQIVITGERGAEDVEAMVREVNSHFIPNRVLLFGGQDQFLHPVAKV